MGLYLGTQNLLEGVGSVDGTGTPNYLTKWNDADTIEDSIISDDGAIATVSGALVVTGTTKLDTSLSGLLQATAGVVTGGGSTGVSGTAGIIPVFNATADGVGDSIITNETEIPPASFSFGAVDITQTGTVATIVPTTSGATPADFSLALVGDSFSEITGRTFTFTNVSPTSIIANRTAGATGTIGNTSGTITRVASGSDLVTIAGGLEVTGTTTFPNGFTIDNFGGPDFANFTNFDFVYGGSFNYYNGPSNFANFNTQSSINLSSTIALTSAPGGSVNVGGDFQVSNKTGDTLIEVDGNAAVVALGSNDVTFANIAGSNGNNAITATISTGSFSSLGFGFSAIGWTSTINSVKASITIVTGSVLTFETDTAANAGTLLTYLQGLGFWFSQFKGDSLVTIGTDLTVTGVITGSINNINPVAGTGGVAQAFDIWAGTQTEFDNQFDSDGSGTISGTAATTDGSVIYIITNN